MAVYKRSYKAYGGRLTPAWSRFAVLTRYSFAELLETKLFLVLAIASFVPVLVFAAGVYLTNSETARAVLQLGNNPPFSVNNSFFYSFMQTQGLLAMIFTAWVGPTLITGDLSNNALPLFLSRPLSRVEYVLGKFMVLFVMLSAFTWVPGLLLFGLQVQMGPDGWLSTNWYIAPAVFLGSLAWISLLSLLALAVSAWVKWRVLASGLFVALMFLPAGFGEAINEALRTHWGALLNLPRDAWFLYAHLLRLPVGVTNRFGFREVPVEFAAVALIGMGMVSLYMLNRRLVAREVVRG